MARIYVPKDLIENVIEEVDGLVQIYVNQFLPFEISS